jgi:hypothetical protein
MHYHYVIEFCHQKLFVVIESIQKEVEFTSKPIILTLFKTNLIIVDCIANKINALKLERAKKYIINNAAIILLFNWMNCVLSFLT